jgi:hypothetical protein
MSRRTLTDAERIVSIREVIEAARGDWHEATALYSIGADLNWLLDLAANQRTALREAIGYSDEETGLEHWHFARGGRTSPDERAGVFVDRGQVLDAIERIVP